MRVRGKLVPGVARGADLITRYALRLENLLGFKPYPGTLDIQIENPVDIRFFETKRIEHVLLDGSIWIDARLAPVRLYVKDQVVDCWWIREEHGVFDPKTIELISAEPLIKKFNLKYDDEVELELKEIRAGIGWRVRLALRKIFSPFRSERRLMR